MDNTGWGLIQAAQLDKRDAFMAKMLWWQPQDSLSVQPPKAEKLLKTAQGIGKLYVSAVTPLGLWFLMVFDQCPEKMRAMRLWIICRQLMESLENGELFVSQNLHSPNEVKEDEKDYKALSDWWLGESVIEPKQAKMHRRQIQTYLKKGQFNYIPGYISRMMSRQPFTAAETWCFVPLLMEAVWAQFPQMGADDLLTGLDFNEISTHPAQALVAWAVEVSDTLKAQGDMLASSPIDRVIAGIQADCSLPYSQKNLAQSLGLTPAYFCRLFYEKTGSHFSQYLTQTRMEKACRILQENPDLPLMKAAQSCGYPHKSYFCQVFKKHYGISPGEYQLKFK